jgi:hypothetical protein
MAGPKWNEATFENALWNFDHTLLAAMGVTARALGACTLSRTLVARWKWRS